MAEVLLVKHEDLGTLHALKLLRIGFEAGRERLLQEGRIQARLQHPNVVAVTNVVQLPGTHGLVMEYVNGPELGTLLERMELSLVQADDVARQLLAGVAAAHELGLVHRDLKPSNVLLAVEPDRVVVKVTDFGLAKALAEESVTNTRSGTTMGTPLYMAPEQFRNAKHADHRADVFSLGALLYELVSGRKVFDGNDLIDIYMQKVDRTYPPIRELVPRIPTRMEAAIEGALHPDLEQRIPTVSALLDTWVGDAPPPWNAWVIEDRDRLLATPGADGPPSDPTAQLIDDDPGSGSAPSDPPHPSGEPPSAAITRPALSDTWTSVEVDPPTMWTRTRRALGVVLGLSVLGAVGVVLFGLAVLALAWWPASEVEATDDALGAFDVEPAPARPEIPGRWTRHDRRTLSFGNAGLSVPTRLLEKEFNWSGRTHGGLNPGYPWIALSPVHEVTVGPVEMLDEPVTGAVWRALGGTTAVADDEVVLGLDRGAIAAVLNAFSARQGWSPGVDAMLQPEEGTGLRLPSEAEWEAFATPSDQLEHVFPTEPTPAIPGRGRHAFVLRGRSRHQRALRSSWDTRAGFRLARTVE
jgi:serine/threonine-protein kinase